MTEHPFQAFSLLKLHLMAPDSRFVRHRTAWYTSSQEQLSGTHQLNFHLREKA